jgi:hypothetical protein
LPIEVQTTVGFPAIPLELSLDADDVESGVGQPKPEILSCRPHPENDDVGLDPAYPLRAGAGLSTS